MNGSSSETIGRMKYSGSWLIISYGSNFEQLFGADGLRVDPEYQLSLDIFQGLRSKVIAIKLLDLVPPDRTHPTIMSSSNLIVRVPSLTR
jgi:hypothetical protein